MPWAMTGVMLVVTLASVTAGCAQENLPPPVVVAIADMAAHLNVQPEQVTVVGLEEVTWSDASLGCPLPGMMYAQVLVPGYRVTLEAVGRRFEYHTDRTSRAVRVAQAQMTPPDVAVPEDLPEVVGKAITDLSARLRVESSEIKTISFNEKMWTDGSLGLPDPGMVYTKAIVSGYLVVLETGGRQYEYNCSPQAAKLAGVRSPEDAKPTVLVMDRTELLDGNNFFELVRMDPDAGGETEVVFPAMSGYAVTPDGKDLAVIVRTSRSSHTLLVVGEGGLEIEIDKAFEFGSVEWSPLGGTLAYWKRPTIMERVSSLEICNATGGERHRIVPDVQGADWFAGSMAWTLDGLVFTIYVEGEGPRGFFWDGTETKAIGSGWDVLGWIPRTWSVIVYEYGADDAPMTLGALRVPDGEMVPLMQAPQFQSAAAIPRQNAVLAIVPAADQGFKLVRVSWGGVVEDLMDIPGTDAGPVRVGPAGGLVTLGYVGPDDSVVEALRLGEELSPLLKIERCPGADPIVR